MRVFVYWNLHRSLWSIKALEGPNKGRVVAHKDTVALHGATPKVSEAGRQRVLREQRKNVHAGVTGEWLQTITSAPCASALGLWDEVTYNPYKGPSFVFKDTGAQWLGSTGVTVMHNRRVYA